MTRSRGRAYTGHFSGGSVGPCAGAVCGRPSGSLSDARTPRAPTTVSRRARGRVGGCARARVVGRRRDLRRVPRVERAPRCGGTPRTPVVGIEQVVVAGGLGAPEVLAPQLQPGVAREAAGRRRRGRRGRAARARRGCRRAPRTTAPSRGSTSGGSCCRSRPSARRRRRCRPWRGRRSACPRRSRGRTRGRGRRPPRSTMRVARSRPMRAAGPGDAAVAVGVARHHHDDVQLRLRPQRVGERPRGRLRPEVLVLEVDEPPGARQRLQVRPGDAALAVGRERVRRAAWPDRCAAPAPRAARTVRVRPRRGGSGSGWRGWRVTRADDAPDRVVVVERVRVLPPLAEGVGERGDRGPVHLELRVVPRRSVAVPRRRARSPAGRRGGGRRRGGRGRGRSRRRTRRRRRGPSRAADHEQLLVVAPPAAHTLVEQDLAAGPVHRSW